MNTETMDDNDNLRRKLLMLMLDTSGVFCFRSGSLAAMDALNGFSGQCDLRLTLRYLSRCLSDT